MHPIRIGAIYGLIAAVIQVLTVQVNHLAFNTNGQHEGNGWVGFIGAFLLPLVALYLAGHYAGRHERLNISTTITSGMRSTLHGTGSGIISGLVFIILVGLINKLNLPYKPSDSGTWGDVLGTLGYVGGLIGWPFVGILLGTIGGALGDNLAHNELRKGQVPTKPAA